MDIRQRIAQLERRLPAPPRPGPYAELSDAELIERGREVAADLRTRLAEHGIEPTPDEARTLERLEEAGQAP